jgi:hypothetical protein
MIHHAALYVRMRSCLSLPNLNAGTISPIRIPITTAAAPSASVVMPLRYRRSNYPGLDIPALTVSVDVPIAA